MWKIITLTLALAGCQTNYENKNPVGQPFPQISGTALNGKTWTMPKDFAGKPAVLLLGYKQRSQFDIDRWLIGLDQTKTKANVFEIPAIQSWFAGLFRDRIDNGMRKGIPDELWKVVITVYDDGEKLQSFTGNENGNNARVMVLNRNGEVVFFHDRGFSVSALNGLRSVLDQAENEKP